jgi:hypothetical protein
MTFITSDKKKCRENFDPNEREAAKCIDFLEIGQSFKIKELSRNIKILLENVAKNEHLKFF